MAFKKNIFSTKLKPHILKMRKSLSPIDKMERKEAPLQRTQEPNDPNNRILPGILKSPRKSPSVNKASSNLGQSQNSLQSIKVRTDTTKRKPGERSTLGNDSSIINYTSDKSPSVLRTRTNNRTGSNICFSGPEESTRRVKIIRKQSQDVPREVIAGPSRFYPNAGERKKQVEFADLDEVYGTITEYSSSESDTSLPYSKDCPYIYQTQNKTPDTLFLQPGSSNKVEKKLADSTKEGKKGISYLQLSRVKSSTKPRSELIRRIGEKKDLSERQNTQLVEVATSIEGLLEPSSPNKKDEITVDVEFVIDKSNSKQTEAFSSKNETTRTYDTGPSPSISNTKTISDHSTHSGYTNTVHNPISTQYASFLHDYIYIDDETSMENLPNINPSYSQTQTSSTHQAVRERYSDFLPKSKNSVISHNLEKTMQMVDDISKRSSFKMTKSTNPSIFNKDESSQIVQKNKEDEKVATTQAEAISSKNKTISAYETGLSSSISLTKALPDHISTYLDHTNIVHSAVLTKHRPTSFLHDYNKEETSMSNLPNFKPSYSQDQTASTYQTVRERDVLPKTEKSVMPTTQNLEKTISTLDDKPKRKSSFSTTKSISPLENVPTLNKREPFQIIPSISKPSSHMDHSPITLPGREGVDSVSRVKQTPSDLTNKISYINIDQSIPVTFLNSKKKQSNNDINIPFEIYVDISEKPLLLTEKVHSGSATKRYSRENIAEGKDSSSSVEISNFLYAKEKGKGSHERVESSLNIENSKRKENFVDDKSEIKVQSPSFSNKMNALSNKSTIEVELNRSIRSSSQIPANEVSTTPLTRKTNESDSKLISLMTSTPITETARKQNVANEDQIIGTKLNQSSNGISKDLLELKETNTEETPNHLVDAYNKYPQENDHASKNILAFRGQTNSQTPFENAYRSKKTPDKEVQHGQVHEVMANESVGAEDVKHKPTAETKFNIQNESAAKGLNDVTLTNDQRDMESSMPIDRESSNDTPEVVYVGRIPNTTYNVFFATRRSIKDSDTSDENEAQEQNESVNGGPKGLLIFVNKKTKIDVSESEDTDVSSEENIPPYGDGLDQPPTRKRKPSAIKHESPATQPKRFRKRPGSGRASSTEDEYGKRSKDKGTHDLKSGIGDGTRGPIVRGQISDKRPGESTSSKQPKDLKRPSTAKKRWPSPDKRDGKWVTIYRSPSGLKKTQKYPCGCLRLFTFDPDTEEIVSSFCRDGSLCEVQKNKTVMKTPIKRKPSGGVSRLGSRNVLGPEIEICAEVAVSKHRIQDRPPAPTFRGGDFTASIGIKSSTINGACNLYLDPRLVKYMLENNEKYGPRQLPRS